MFELEFSKREIKEAIKNFEEVRQRVEDLSDYYKNYARPLIIEEIKEVFETNNQGTWEPRKDNEPHPLLRKTLLLYNSWTKVNAIGNINRITNSSLEWGTGLFYMKFLEEGTSRMVARPVRAPVIQTRREFRRSLKRKLNEALMNTY